MKNQYIYVDYDWGDPWKNLAWETCLFELVAEAAKRGERLFVAAVWQNDNTIVIGRNQNPRAECNMDVVRERNIRIARRITGGGAVYHDRGNLNFTFCFPRDCYDVTMTSGIIVDAVKALGIQAELSGRNDILANGRKFSGNAFHTDSHAGLHHGTILIRSNAKNIHDCLTPDKLKFKRPETASTRSNIVTLAELVPDIAIDQVKENIETHFCRKISGMIDNSEKLENDGTLVDHARFKEVCRKYCSEEWIWGEVLPTTELTGYFPWGKLTLSFFSKNGKVYDCGIATDSLHVEIWQTLKDAWAGKDYAKEPLLKEVELAIASAGNEDLIGVLRDVFQFMKNNALP